MMVVGYETDSLCSVEEGKEKKKKEKGSVRSNDVSSGKSKPSRSSDGLRKGRGKGKGKERGGKVDIPLRPDPSAAAAMRALREQSPEWHLSSAGRSLVSESELKEWEEMQKNSYNDISNDVVVAGKEEGKGGK